MTCTQIAVHINSFWRGSVPNLVRITECHFTKYMSSPPTKKKKHSTRIAQLLKVSITLSVYWELTRIVIAPQYSIIIL